MRDAILPSTVAGHLARRLHESGVRHLFGVPGDFCLDLLDALAGTGLFTWVGTANELDAGYAADGYARRSGLAAVVTTYGVGELGLLSAIAGSYAEHVPVVQITGAPTTSASASGALAHHTLGDGDHGHFARAFAEVTAVTEVLAASDTPRELAERIDRVVAGARDRLRPTYLSIPSDLVHAPVEAPAGPLAPPAGDAEAVAAFEAAVATLFAERLPAGGRPVVVAGHVVQRLHAEPALQALAEAGDLPVVTLLDAAGVLDGHHPCHAGVYAAALGDPGPAATVRDAPVLVRAGTLLTDLLSGFFTHVEDPAATVVLDVAEATVGGQRFAGVRLADGLAVLTRLVSGLPRAVGRAAVRRRPPGPGPDVGQDHAPLTQAGLWRAVQQALRPHRLLVADIGTAFFGAADLDLPEGTTFLAQPVWSAIGWSLPATVGAGLADPGRRPMLVIGDGAAQMTAAELGLLAERVPGATVVLVDNAGYTIERALQSPKAQYNDVPAWDWPALVRALAPASGVLTTRVTTPAELVAALAEAQAHPDRAAVVVAVTAPHDVPPRLAALAAAQGSTR